MYYIYHIPQRNKIGVAVDVTRRMREHRWKGFYEILETHTCEFKVSDREVELQIQYFGKRDSNILYWQTLKLASYESRGKGGKLAMKKVTNEQRKQGGIESARSRRIITYEMAEYIRAQYKRGKDVLGKPISQRRLGRVFKMNQQGIWAIVNNKSYTTP